MRVAGVPAATTRLSFSLSNSAASFGNRSRRDVSPFTFPIDALVLACTAMSSGLFENRWLAYRNIHAQDIVPCVVSPRPRRRVRRGRRKRLGCVPR
jgi:hypothetical protein